MKYCPDDKPISTSDFTILTSQQLSIPGLHMFGYANHRTPHLRLGTHYHHTMEIVVILNGKQQYYIGDQHYVLNGGDIFMTLPEELHGNKDHFQDICEYVWFQFLLPDTQKDADHFLGLTPPNSHFLYQQIRDYRQHQKKANPKELPLLRKVFLLLSSDDPAKKMLGYSYFLQFITNNICNRNPAVSDTTATPSYSPDIQAAVTYIHDHLCTDLDIQKLASCADLSSSHFQVKFKEQVGFTPYQYILNRKMDLAKELMQNPQYSMTDIALELNFSSSSHFASVFRKYTGYTPTQFNRSVIDISQ